MLSADMSRPSFLRKFFRGALSAAAPAVMARRFLRGGTEDEVTACLALVARRSVPMETRAVFSKGFYEEARDAGFPRAALFCAASSGLRLDPGELGSLLRSAVRGGRFSVTRDASPVVDSFSIIANRPRAPVAGLSLPPLHCGPSPT